MKRYLKASKWDEQFIPEDVYDDDEKYFDEHATRYMDAYDHILDNISNYRKKSGVKLVSDSDEFYALLENGDAPTVIGPGLILKMAQENWLYTEIDNFVLDRLAKLKS